MSTTRFIATTMAICLMLAGSAAIAQRSNGDFTLGVGIVALTGTETGDWYGSGGYNVGVDYRVTGKHDYDQSVSLSYFKSSGQTLVAGGVPFDSWLSSWTVGTTFRKRPTYDNKLYYGFGGGLCLMTERGSVAGVTTERNADPSLELHGLAGVALSESVRLEAGYTQFLRSVHNPWNGASASAGGAFTFSIGGRF